MRRWITDRRRRRLEGVSFCETCGQICDRGCRARAAHRAQQDRALGTGVLR